MTRTKEQIIAENTELKSRLVETEEALAAIRSGEVDAIVVPGRKGEQVYSISSAETPYRTFIEEMEEGAVTLSKDGLIIYCNQRFAGLVGEPIEHVIGTYFSRFIIPNARPKFDRLIRGQGQKKKDVLILSLVNSLYLKLSFHLLPSYLQGDNCILVATDISEIKKEEKKLLDLSRVLEQKLEMIQRLRMQLIERKIDAEAEIKKLKNANSKLASEVSRLKQAEADLKQKVKLQKRTG